MKTQPESKCPELLANYCDMLLRKTPLSKKLNSEEIELKLKEVVSLSCSPDHQTSNNLLRSDPFLHCLSPFSPSFNPSSLSTRRSSWCWSTSRTKTCSCVTTRLTWLGGWSWTSQRTVRPKKTWWSGSEWVLPDYWIDKRVSTFNNKTNWSAPHFILLLEPVAVPSKEYLEDALKICNKLIWFECSGQRANAPVTSQITLLVIIKLLNISHCLIW